MGCGMHVEVNFTGFPLLTDFDEQGCHESENGGLVGEEGGDPGSAFELLVDSFQRVGGPELSLMGGWQGKDGEALRQVILHPGRELHQRQRAARRPRQGR